MKANLLLLFPLLPSAAAIAFAQATLPEPRPPVPVAVPDTTLVAPRSDNQRSYAPPYEPLIAPETAKGIVENFRKAYTSTNAPRVVIYVNRELVDTGSSFKTHTDAHANGNAGAASAATHTAGTNDHAANGAATPTLADRQTVREIERLFGRAFRNAGALLADQKNAATLLDDKTGGLLGDQAARDRAVLANIADVAVEVLISSRTITLAGVSGDRNYAVPDIQATAIRLKDSAIIGQAAASDVLGKDGHAAWQYDVREVTEATAFVLMEDMLTGAKQPVER